MFRKMLRAKIHRATVTRCDPDYVGSITIDADLLAAADIRPNEAVSVFDLDNAVRFETYVIRGEAGSGDIAINGAAAKLVEVGHCVIIVCFGYLEPRELDRHEAKVVLVDSQNRLQRELRYDSRIQQPADVDV